MTPPSPHKKTLTGASRQEYADLPLQVIMGELPLDIYGAVYFSSPVGTIESGGLPYPEGQEEGSPVFNGDGMILKIDFSQAGQANISAQILKPPCYLADEVVSTVPSDHHYYKKGFFNIGISRLSRFFGVRNQLNTAMLPIRLPGEEVDRLLATFDTGRPYEFDPHGLQLYHPLGNNADWRTQYFPMMQYVFPMIASTAHPAYDPRTAEFFSVNYTKSLLNMMRPPKSAIRGDQVESFLQYVNNLFDEFLDLWQAGEKYADHDQKEKRQHQLINKLEKRLQKSPILDEEIKVDEWSLNENAVFVLKRGADGQIQSWRVKDPQGDDIRIAESMHQTGITEDYFVFIDSSFKISMDLLIPYFRKPWTLICRFLRNFWRSKLKGYTNVYIVRRSDLTPDVSTVKAACVRVPKEETVHFSVNYRNPNRTITLHTAHNSSLCAAEWVRNYDRLAIDPDEKVDPHAVGLPTIGEMDVSKIGKLKIKVRTRPDDSIEAELKSMKLICEPLELEKVQGVKEDFQQLGPNTWGIGLHTYYQLLAPDTVVDEIPYIFWQMYGLDYQILTHYIYKMYEEESNLIKPIDVLKYTENGIPFSIVRQNTQTMTLEDYYYFTHDQYLRSIQFVPKKDPSEGVIKELYGYIVCTVVVQEVPEDPYSYKREIWIFDAAQLSKGPVCKLSNEALSFAFTIHSVWLPNPQKVQPAWSYDVQEDYEQVLQSFSKKDFADEIRVFMHEHVYSRMKQ